MRRLKHPNVVELKDVMATNSKVRHLSASPCRLMMLFSEDSFIRVPAQQTFQHDLHEIRVGLPLQTLGSHV
jgi:hypothetical protein